MTFWQSNVELVCNSALEAGLGEVVTGLGHSSIFNNERDIPGEQPTFGLYVPCLQSVSQGPNYRSTKASFLHCIEGLNKSFKRHFDLDFVSIWIAESEVAS